MKLIGQMLVALGTALILLAIFGISTSVEVEGYGESMGSILGSPRMTDAVSNLHGMHIQSLVLLSGLASIASGLLSFGFGSVLEKLDALGLLQTTNLPSPASTDAYEEHFRSAGAEAVTFDDDALANLGITQVGEQYAYQSFRYDRVEDAIAYAKKQRGES